MKALLFLFRRIVPLVLVLLLTFSVSCIRSMTEETEAPPEEVAMEEDGEDDAGLILPVYSSGGEEWEEVFYPVCESEHAVAYVSAHALQKEKAEELLADFEDKVLPWLPLLPIPEEKKLSILITSMEGHTYGYMPPMWQEGEYGPVVCLNALYPDDLSYALAHEYQHLCVYTAAKEGNVELDEETDELLSDMFCEFLFPGHGAKRGILSEERALIVQERIDLWGEDVFSHVYDLLRAGYGAEEIRSDLESR